MALSGSKTVAFCSRNGANRFYLQWSWSATQNVVNNQSTVKVLLYLGSYGNGYGMNASATKSGTITINGNTKNFTTAGIKLSSGGKIKIGEHSVTISHNSDGTKSFAINASYNPAVTISGTSQGNVSMGSTTYTLNTIARASTISCNGKWTFPNNHTISISRKNSAFKHTVRLYVKDMSTPLKTWDKTSSTSFSTSFTLAENTTIASRLGTGSATPSVATKIEVDTYSGSTKIGSTATVSGTCTATTRSTTTFTNNWNIGATISGKITENNSAFNHTVQLLKSDGTEIVKITNNNNTINWTYNTGDIASTLYALTPNSNSYTGIIRIRTYYNSTQVGSHAQSNITFKVANSNPTFSPTIAYSDIDTTITGKTGNNQYIVQNKSSLRVTCTVSSSTLAAKNSATLKTIQATVAGVTKSMNYSSSATVYTFDFGTVNASSNQSCTIQAIDSRGNKTSASKTITFVPYSPPKMTAKVERANKFSATVNVNTSGTYSPVSIGGTVKNTIASATFTRGVDGGSQANSTGITTNASGGSWKSAQAVFTLAETSIATVVITMTDTFGSTVKATIDVPTGIPTMYVDADKGNISFNAMPDMTKSNNMKIGMQIDAPPNQYWTDGTAGTTSFAVKGSYGINMNNSDLVGLGGIFFNDVCESGNHNEGIYFVNSGNMSTAGNSGNTWFSRMYMRDGLVWIGTNTGDANGRGSVIAPTCIGRALSASPLWEGGYYMTSTHIINLTGTNSLYNQPTGWLLAWSDYDSNTGTKNNFDWVFTLIPKQAKDYITGTIFCTMPVNLSETGVVYALKKLSVTNTKITGHDLNAPTSAGGHNADAILRYVFSV